MLSRAQASHSTCLSRDLTASLRLGTASMETCLFNMSFSESILLAAPPPWPFSSSLFDYI